MLTTLCAPASAQREEAPSTSPLLMPNLSGLRMTPAQARTPEEFFTVFDADDNGCIDRGEWRRRIMAIFYALDTEGKVEPTFVGVRGDEELTHSEIPGLSDEMFAAADLDGNGRITGYEFNQASWTRFDSANPGIVDCLDITVFTEFLESLQR